MSAAAPSRLMLRQTRFLARQTRRHASTTEAAKDTAAKSKETASNVQSKASEGLSKVSSSEGSALSGAVQGVSNAVSKIGGRTGRLMSFVESMVPATIYYSKVGLELSKLIVKGQQMSPPNVASFQRYMTHANKAIRNPAGLLNEGVNTSTQYTPEGILSRIRNVNRQEMATLGVIGAEVLGFFTIGEMIGRMKVVGYTGDVEHHETATNTH